MDENLRKTIYENARRKVERIYYAALYGDIDTMKELMDEGLWDVNGLNYWQVDCDPKGWSRTPLHAAVLGNQPEMVRYLIKEGANIDVKTKYGDTPLHYALTEKNFFISTLLLLAGARSDVENDDGKTAQELIK